ncbi:MAG TPA: glycine cleavage system aminomethyltransferase GcvT [Gemmatimonadaceae bacterium]|nr:MAG: glycine cleavage system protein T [Gemmatimonadetes bacterium SCN 70-22]HMN09599.1 glycine cleavage system aminomethyltransferase GcvT [Gemmatimonadaceae bacterium]
MDQSTSAPLKRTPLHAIHVALGAKMVPFAGYEMPVQYPTGITVEHKAVRERCGLFDVSHMGEFTVRGPQAVDFVNAVTTNNAATLQVGQVQYSGILNERGTFEDDCLVYREDDGILLVVNASNKDKDFAHISKQLHRFDCTLADVSDQVALLALQGPLAKDVLQPLADVDLSAIGYYHFVMGRVAGVGPMHVSRTGYTGEDGFELYFDPAHAETVWNALTADARVTPAGLGCRDSLRLEMGMALYGNDIDDTVTPLEANLGWITKLAKGDFTGRDALVRQKEQGVARKLVAFTLSERAIPRHGYPVFCDGLPSGTVCSGAMSPSLGIPIGTCYLPTPSAKEGTGFEVEIRGKRVAATVVKPPFYKNGSHR